MATPIGTLGTIPSLTVGGRVFTDLTNLIILSASTGGSANNVSTLRKFGASSGYQVTTGKTLTIYAIKVISQSSTGEALNFGYGDTDVGIRAGTTNPTNAVFAIGDSSNMLISGLSQVGGVTELAINLAVPSLKYVFAKAGDTGVSGFLAYGYES